MEYLRRGFSQNKKGRDPIGFSRKAKAKRKYFLIVGLEARSRQIIAVHDLKGRGNLNSQGRRLKVEAIKPPSTVVLTQTREPGGFGVERTEVAYASGRFSPLNLSPAYAGSRSLSIPPGSRRGLCAVARIRELAL